MIAKIPNVKHIIAVASGKGGVGKSTTAVNLALALQQSGFRTGILDADIYGPSQPTMLGATGKPEVNKKGMLPVQKHGIQSMSIGYLIDMNTPMVWRGPMATTALLQLLNDTQWDNLDYLILDLPPGTGDIQLTLAQKIPMSGAVIVTTPQDLALLDARRAYEMFNKVSVPVFGIIENMSLYTCSNCGHEDHIFGEGGGEKLAREYHLDFLGSLPLDRSIREHADHGQPSVIADPNGKIAAAYKLISDQVVGKTSSENDQFPIIEIKND